MGSTRPGRGVLVEGFPGGEQLRGVKRGRGELCGVMFRLSRFSNILMIFRESPIKEVFLRRRQ